MRAHIFIPRMAALTAVVALVLLAASGQAKAQGFPSISTVVISGDPAPGAGEEVTFSVLGDPSANIGAPVLNELGQTAFIARIEGIGVDSTNDTGIWSNKSGSLALVAREGDQAPGTPPIDDVKFSFFLPPLLSSAGQTVFAGLVLGPGFFNEAGIWSNASGTLAAIALAKDVAPGTVPAETFRGTSTTPDNLVLNDAGATAFRGFLQNSDGNTSNDIGIWSDHSGTLALVMRGDDEAPVAELGISFFGPNTLVMNDAGLVVFHAFLNGGAGGRSIWSDESGTLSLIAREGDPAPGIDGANYSFLLSNPGVNNAGQIAFKANTKIGGAFGPQGIWLHDPGVFGDPELIVESGDPAPGTSKTFSGFFEPVVNGAGQIAFKAQDTGGKNGIWSEGFGGLH